MHTIAVICTTEVGDQGTRDLELKALDMRKSCREHGFELDGGYYQGPFDANIWPFKALSNALNEEEMPIIVVTDLTTVATHELALTTLPNELEDRSKKLYSILDKRLFDPLDEDFQEHLRKAFDRWSSQ